MRNKIIVVSVMIFAIFSWTLWAEEKQKIEKTSDKTLGPKVEEEVQKRLPQELENKIKKFSPENFAILSREMLEKEDALNVRAKKLTVDEEQLKISQEQLAKNIIDFETRQKKFIGCLDQSEAEKNTRIDKAVEVVANMRPQTAADMLAVQDPTLSVQILSRLDSSKSSKIFNLMNKEISAKLQKLYLDMKQ